MNNKTYFPQLTGLRAVAALLVFVHHFAFAEEKVGRFLFRLQGELYIGVSIFFVLSGFLITTRYYDQAISLRQYAINRFARIYPMYFLLSVLTFLVYMLQPGLRFYDEAMGKHIPQTIFMNLTFLRGFFDELKLTGIPQGWTLTVEECFYFFAPVLFMLLRKHVRLLWVLAGLYIIGALLVVLPKGDNSLGFFNSFQFMWLTTFFGRSFDFFVGVQLARWFSRRTTPQRKGVAFTLGGALLLILTIVVLATLNVKEARYEYGLYTLPGLLINNWVLPVAIGVFFWGLITEASAVSKLLSTRVFDWLGRSSYTFYLIHMGVISLFVVSIVQKWVIQLPLLLILSLLLYRFVEEPLNRWFRKMGSGTK